MLLLQQFTKGILINRDILIYQDHLPPKPSGLSIIESIGTQHSKLPACEFESKSCLFFWDVFQWSHHLDIQPRRDQAKRTTHPLTHLQGLIINICSLYQLGHSFVNVDLQLRLCWQRLSDGQSIDGCVTASKVLYARPLNWIDCVTVARLKFEKYFNHRVCLWSSFLTSTERASCISAPYWQRCVITFKICYYAIFVFLSCDLAKNRILLVLVRGFFHVRNHKRVKNHCYNMFPTANFSNV